MAMRMSPPTTISFATRISEEGPSVERTANRRSTVAKHPIGIVIVVV
jgi:hypothetical protein